MHTVKVFTIGDFQAVCIPDEYRFDTDEVFIIKVGDIVLLTSDPSLAGDLGLSVSCLTDHSRPGGVTDSEICCKLEEAECEAELTDRRLSAGDILKAVKEAIKGVEPEVAHASPGAVSIKTLKAMDAAVANLKSSTVSEAIDLSEFDN